MMFDFTPLGFRGEMTAPTYEKSAKTKAVSRHELSILFQDILGEATAFGCVCARDNGDPVLEDEHLAAAEVEVADPQGVQEVAEMIEFPGGPDIPVVREFDCTADRLFLDFEGREDDAPYITIDFDTFPGHALVEANGIAVTFLVGAKDLTKNRVDIVMSGTQPQSRHTPSSARQASRLPRMIPHNDNGTCTPPSRMEMAMH